MKNYLSVIVPVYNVEDHLVKCLDSIINQTFKDLEIILVNDGSTDNSAKICDDYAEKDARIKVIHQQNSGVSTARNRGIDLAAGDYITFVDSDDWLELQMYEKMLEIAQQETIVDVIMCDFKNIKKNSEVEITAEIRKGLYSKEEIILELYPTLIVTENFGRIPIVSVWSCLFKNSFLKDNNIEFDGKLFYSEDYLFMAEVMVKAKSFYYYKGNYFYNYLQYEESRSKKFQPVWWENLLYLNQELKKLFDDSVDFDFSRQLKLQLLHSVLDISSSIYKSNTLKWSEKLNELRSVLKQKEISMSFCNLRLKKQRKAQRIVLFFIKHRMAFTYLVFMGLISTLKNA